MITVVTLGRSASTWYCEQLAKNTGYENLGEVFFSNATANKFRLTNHINKKNDIIIKLTPYEWKRITPPVDIDKIFNNSEQVIFLLRKDFKQQLKSEFGGRYIKNTFNINWHDEFDETYIVPKEYIDTNWENFVKMFTSELKYITELYETVNITTTKSIVYTEDIVAKDFNKLNRPIEFEIPLNFDITL
jgi:hypothetical protein